MSDTTTISHRGQKHLERKLAAILTALGYTVLPPDPEWTTPGAVAKRFGILSSALSRVLSRNDRPNFPATLGRTGRIKTLVLTKQLEAFIASHTKSKPQ